MSKYYSSKKKVSFLKKQLNLQHNLQMTKTICIIFALISFISVKGQQNVFTGLTDDANLQNRYKQHIDQNYKESRKQPKTVYKKEILNFYKSRYQSSLNRSQKGHFYFNNEIQEYLDGLIKRIAENNKEYNFDEIFLLLTKYTWPNAFSVGDGTIAVNIGLATKLSREAQLAFIICHEAAHYFLNHSDRNFIQRFEYQNSKEFMARLQEINKTTYYQTSKVAALLRANIYSERHHNRSLEYEADSLGLVLYLNSGFDIGDAISTLELLDQLNEPLDDELSVFQSFNIDTITYSKSSLKIQNANKEDVLHDDSIKTHPDIIERIEIFESLFITKNNHKQQCSEDFKNFLKQIYEEEIHAMLYFNSIGPALVKALKRKETVDDDPKVNSTIVITLEKIVTARKNHEISKYINFPSGDMNKAEKELSAIAHALRFKTLCASFYDYANEIYNFSLKDEKTLYSMVLLAHYAGNKHTFDSLRAKFLKEFNQSKNYLFIRNLNL